MRATPNSEAQRILTIPHNSEVTLLEEVDPLLEISGKSGKWTRVRYGDSEGWVFGGFLSTEKVVRDPNCKELVPLCGKQCEFESIEKIQISEGGDSGMYPVLLKINTSDCTIRNAAGFDPEGWNGYIKEVVVSGVSYTVHFENGSEGYSIKTRGMISFLAPANSSITVTNGRLPGQYHRKPCYIDDSTLGKTCD